MSIGERITELRKDKKMSQGNLASALEISRQAVSKWENDLSTPDPLKMIKLADILGTDIEYLSTGRKMRTIRPPIVLETVKTVEKVVEKPVVRIIEKTVEVEKPVIEYIEKPVFQKVIRVKYRKDPVELTLVGLLCFVIGFLLGLLF